MLQIVVAVGSCLDLIAIAFLGYSMWKMAWTYADPVGIEARRGWGYWIPMRMDLKAERRFLGWLPLVIGSATLAAPLSCYIYTWWGAMFLLLLFPPAITILSLAHLFLPASTQAIRRSVLAWIGTGLCLYTLGLVSILFASSSKARLPVPLTLAVATLALWAWTWNLGHLLRAFRTGQISTRSLRCRAWYPLMAIWLLPLVAYIIWWYCMMVDCRYWRF